MKGLHTCRGFFVLFLVLVLIVGTGLEGYGATSKASGNGDNEPVASVSTKTGSYSQGLTVEYRTKDEVKQALESVWDFDYKGKFSATPSLSGSGTLGRLSDKTQENALAFLNAIRYIAGLSDDVSLSEDYIKHAQAAAMVIAKNAEVSHYPSKPEGLSASIYKLGKVGARKSNLACGTTDLKRVMTLYMGDSGQKYLGHRRWILYPALEKTGFGMVGKYSAMYVVDNFSKKNAAKTSGVSWPAQTMPLELWSEADAWSVSFGRKLDAKDIKVVLTENLIDEPDNIFFNLGNSSKSLTANLEAGTYSGKSENRKWVFSSKHSDGDFYVCNENYGQPGCVIFTPDDIDCCDGASFHVTITEKGKKIADYDVNFFEALA